MLGGMLVRVLRWYMLSLAVSLYIYSIPCKYGRYLHSYAIRPHSSYSSLRRPSIIQRTPFLGVAEQTRHGRRRQHVIVVGVI